MIIPIKIHNHIFVPKSIWKKRDIDYSISQQLGEASIMQHAFTCPTKVDENFLLQDCQGPVSRKHFTTPGPCNKQG